MTVIAFVSRLCTDETERFENGTNRFVNEENASRNGTKRLVTVRNLLRKEGFAFLGTVHFVRFGLV